MKNIDIVKVGKNSSANKNNQDSIYRVPRSPKNKPKPRKARSKRIGLGIGFIAKQTIGGMFDGDIFLASLIRNIFSIRTILFVLIPIWYFQLQYLFVLKPDQLLSRLKSFISPQNTFQFVGLGLAILILIILSWLADTILVPAIYRYKYQKIDGRKAKMLNTFKESIRNSAAISANKLYKFITIAIIAGLFIASLYFMYIIGYGSVRSQLWLSVPVVLIFSFIILIYSKFRLYMQASVSVGLSSEQGKYRISFKQAFLKPLRSIQQMSLWLVFFLLAIFASLAVLYLEIQVLAAGLPAIKVALFMAILMTSIYLIWTFWTSFQSSFGVAMLNYERSITKLHFQIDEDSGYFGFFIIIILLLIVIAIYFAVSFALSTQISDILVSIWEKLPDSVKVNLPKPK